MSKSALWSVVAIVVVVAAVIVVALVAPNTKKSSNRNTKLANGLTANQESAYTKQITSDVTTFFAANTSLQQRENLLQNGSQFAQVMQAEFAQLDNQKPSVTIKNVSFPNSTTAKVDYTINLNGQPVLSDQTGEALLISNTWKVSDTTLCQLLGLGGSAPSFCNNIH